MNKLQLAGLALIGFFLYNSLNKKRIDPKFRNIPPPPPRSSKIDYDKWIKQVIATSGLVKGLFDEGGPLYGLFRGKDDSDLLDILDSPGGFDPFGDIA